MAANFTITPSAGGSAAAMAAGSLTINIAQVQHDDPDQDITLTIENTGDETITITGFNRAGETPWNVAVTGGSPQTIAPAATNTNYVARLARRLGIDAHIPAPTRGLLVINYTLSGSPTVARDFQIACFAVITFGTGTAPTFTADDLARCAGSYHSNALAPATVAAPAGTDTFTWKAFDDPTSGIRINTLDGYQCMYHMMFGICRDEPFSETQADRLIGFPMEGLTDLTMGNHINYTDYPEWLDRFNRSGFTKQEVRDDVAAAIARLKAFPEHLPGAKLFIYEGSVRQLPDVLSDERVNNNNPWGVWRNMKLRLDLWADCTFADIAFDVPYGVSSWDPQPGTRFEGLANPIIGIRPSDSYRYWGYKWLQLIKAGDGLKTYSEPIVIPQEGFFAANGFGLVVVAQGFRDVFEFQGIGPTFAELGDIAIIDFIPFPTALNRQSKIYAIALAFMLGEIYAVTVRWMPYLWIGDPLSDTSNVISEIQTLINACYSSKGSYTP